MHFRVQSLKLSGSPINMSTNAKLLDAIFSYAPMTAILNLKMTAILIILCAYRMHVKGPNITKLIWIFIFATFINSGNIIKFFHMILNVLQAFENAKLSPFKRHVKDTFCIISVNRCYLDSR